MSFLIRLLSRCPLWFLHGVGWLVGYGIYLFSRDYRERFHTQLHQAGYSWHVGLRALGQAGCSVLESPRLWFGAQVPVRWDGQEVVQAAYASGRGVIFLTPHLGCFEVTAPSAAALYGARYGPMTVLYRPARQAWLASMLQASRSRQGMLTVPTNLLGVRKLLKAFRNTSLFTPMCWNYFLLFHVQSNHG